MRREIKGERNGGRELLHTARGARKSEKGKNERGGEMGKRDEAEIQKVLTS